MHVWAGVGGRHEVFQVLREVRDSPSCNEVEKEASKAGRDRLLLTSTFHLQCGGNWAQRAWLPGNSFWNGDLAFGGYPSRPAGKLPAWIVFHEHSLSCKLIDLSAPERQIFPPSIACSIMGLAHTAWLRTNVSECSGQSCNLLYYRGIIPSTDTPPPFFFFNAGRRAIYWTRYCERA